MMNDDGMRSGDSERRDNGWIKRAGSCYRRLKEIEEGMLYLEQHAPISVTQFNFCSTKKIMRKVEKKGEICQ
jgi:hypothetical protein